MLFATKDDVVKSNKNNFKQIKVVTIAIDS